MLSSPGSFFYAIAGKKRVDGLEDSFMILFKKTVRSAVFGFEKCLLNENGYGNANFNAIETD